MERERAKAAAATQQVAWRALGCWNSLTNCFDVCQVASLTQRMEAASQRADALTEQAARSGAAAEAQRLESVAALKRATEYARAQGRCLADE